MYAFEGNVCPVLSASPALVEILVAGLRWDRADDQRGDDLDLSCVILGPDGAVLDVVHPGRPRNDSGSVVHTGDATTGAGSWDEERVFIFPDALPICAAAAMLVVASASGHALADIRNASCHVSNHETEELLLHIALDEGPRQSACCVASVVRAPTGWQLVPGCPPELRGESLMQALGAAACSKWRAEGVLLDRMPSADAPPRQSLTVAATPGEAHAVDALARAIALRSMQPLTAGTGGREDRAKRP